MTPKQKHNIVMWFFDIIGSLLGGAVLAFCISTMVYFGAGLNKEEPKQEYKIEKNRGLK